MQTVMLEDSSLKVNIMFTAHTTKLALIISTVILMLISITYVAMGAYSTQDAIDRSVVNEHKTWLAANTTKEDQSY